MWTTLCVTCVTWKFLSPGAPGRGSAPQNWTEPRITSRVTRTTFIALAGHHSPSRAYRSVSPGSVRFGSLEHRTLAESASGTQEFYRQPERHTSLPLRHPMNAEQKGDGQIGGPIKRENAWSSDQSELNKWNAHLLKNHTLRLHKKEQIDFLIDILYIFVITYLM